MARSVFVRVLRDWLIRHRLAAFFPGLMLELFAGWIATTKLGKVTTADEWTSLLAAAMLVSATMWALSSIRRVTLSLVIASASVVLGKLLGIARETKYFNDWPLIGIDSDYSMMLPGVCFLVGFLIILYNVFRWASSISQAKNELEERNAELLREKVEREKARAALEESERMLHLVIESIPEAVWWKDLESRYIGCNQHLADMMGESSPGALFGKKDSDYPNLTDHVAEYIAGDRQVIEENKPLIGVVEQVRFPDGAVRHVRTNKVPLHDMTGHVMGVLGTCEDITERRQMEEERARLATALDQSDESIIITDPGGVIQYVNPATEHSTGYTSEELIGRTPRILRTDVHSADFYKTLWDTILRGEVWHGLFVNRRKDGTLYEEQATISPVRNERGDIINFVALKRDVTEERRLERQLRQAQKMEAIGQLAGGIAHDFNNLLQIVSGYVEMAMGGVPPEEKVGRQLRNAHDAISRGARLVRQLLLFGRQQVVEPETLDLNVVVSEMLKMLRRIIGEQIELVFKPSYSPAVVFADHGQMEQVLMNLCLNARDAMSGGGQITLETGTMRVDERLIAEFPWANTGEYIFLSVTDTGTGMPPGVVEHIFEPFFSTKEVGKGTGLGLATVYGIVRQHKGVITVKSSPERGSVFTLCLPAAAVENDDIPSEEGPFLEDAFDIPGGEETLLVAEDEPLVREVAVEFLTQAGYRVLTAGDGEEAMQVYDANAGDIRMIITDVIMPKANGRQVRDHVHQANPGLPVVFCSGYSRDELNGRMSFADAGRIIRKPYQRANLLRTVRKVLDGARR
ncbi:MAG: PAS domain S-box protein [Candidatus Hydrogenedentes bacterium]|nr:PAS domain S-box protein [Candidatus Hydrogenedentota bacterium]